MRDEVVDGGWGYAVLLGVFLSQMLFGLGVRAFGALYLLTLERFETTATMAAWVGSVNLLVFAVASPVASILCHKFTCRVVSATGSLFLSVGFLLTAFAFHITLLFFSFSFLCGIGLAFLSASAFLVMGLWFEKKRALATSLGSSGAAVSLFIMPPLLDFLSRKFGFQGCMIVLSAISLHGLVSALLYRPRGNTPARSVLKEEEDGLAGDDTEMFQVTIIEKDTDEMEMKLNMTQGQLGPTNTILEDREQIQIEDVDNDRCVKNAANDNTFMLSDKAALSNEAESDCNSVCQKPEVNDTEGNTNYDSKASNQDVNNEQTEINNDDVASDKILNSEPECDDLEVSNQNACDHGKLSDKNCCPEASYEISRNTMDVSEPNEGKITEEINHEVVVNISEETNKDLTSIVNDENSGHIEVNDSIEDSNTEINTNIDTANSSNTEMNENSDTRNIESENNRNTEQKNVHECDPDMELDRTKEEQNNIEFSEKNTDKTIQTPKHKRDELTENCPNNIAQVTIGHDIEKNSEENKPKDLIPDNTETMDTISLPIKTMYDEEADDKHLLQIVDTHNSNDVKCNSSKQCESGSRRMCGGGCVKEGGAVSVMFSDSRVFGLMCMMLGMTIASTTFSTFAPALAMETGESFTRAVMLLSYGGIADTVGRIIIGYIMDTARFRPVRIWIYIGCGMISTTLITIFPIIPKYAWYCFVIVLQESFIGTLYAQRTTILADFLGMEKMMLVFGFMQAATSIGLVIGRGLGGTLKDVFQTYATTFYISGALAVVCGAVMVVIVIHKSRRGASHII